MSLVILTACVTSPLGRKQFVVIPEDQMSKMGAQSFDEMKKKEPVHAAEPANLYVACIANPLISTMGGQPSEWEIVVFKDDQANAFALPGKKIGVYLGLLKVAKTDAQLAAVIGHEIGHVIGRHGAERVSQQVGTQAGLAALGAVTGDNPYKDKIMALLGIGAQVGVLLPFSRIQESEADLIGLDLMARAGFDPQQSVSLWENMMAAAGGKAPPELLSTHPASQNRILNLKTHMPDALQAYQSARDGGQRPHCVLSE